MSDLPDTSEAWAAAQKVIAKRLAQQFHRVYEELTPRYFPLNESSPTGWEELRPEDRELLVAVCWEILFGDKGGDLAPGFRR